MASSFSASVSVVSELTIFTADPPTVYKPLYPVAVEPSVESRSKSGTVLISIVILLVPSSVVAVPDVPGSAPVLP